MGIAINIEVPLQGTFLLLYNSQGIALGYDKFALQAKLNLLKHISYEIKS